MINGKYHRKRRLRWRREFVLVCSIVLLLIGMVGGSLAYLFMSTDPVTNTFTAPNIDVTIPETFDGTTKSHVKVTNSCDFDVYVRASYVAYFVAVNDKGEEIKPIVVHPSEPSLNITIGRNWIDKGDGYYLYDSTVPAKTSEKTYSTEDFIVSASLIGEAPAGYTLVIDVIAEVVQANPEGALNAVWGY